MWRLIVALVLLLEASPALGQFNGCGRGFCSTQASGGGGASPPLDGLSPTAAWSASRKLLSSYGGSFYTLTSGKVSTWFDQSGNSRDVIQTTAANRPVIGTLGVDGVVFDGANTRLQSATLMSTLITASTGYMVACIRPTGFTSDSGGSQLYNNAPIIQDGNQNVGILTRLNASGSPILYSESDPNYGVTTIAANVTIVVEWRHQGGQLFTRINGAGETLITAGDTATMGSINIGEVGVPTFQGYIYELATFNAVPALASRDALVQSFGKYCGAF